MGKTLPQLSKMLPMPGKPLPGCEFEPVDSRWVAGGPDVAEWSR